jgi:REP element-mobilizing transposase RayT
MPALEAFAASQQKAGPVRLSETQAVLLLDQFQETAGVRQWTLFAIAIMANHCHLVVGVPGDPDPETLLRDFKSYGSRKLNRNGQPVPLDKRWTKSGSKRKLPDDQAVLNAIQYTIGQEFPLVIWVNDFPELNLKRGRLV